MPSRVTACPTRGDTGENVRTADGGAKTWTEAEVAFMSP